MSRILSQLVPNLLLGAEGACAILCSDIVALRRNLRNYLIATVVGPRLF